MSQNTSVNIASSRNTNSAMDAIFITCITLLVEFDGGCWTAGWVRSNAIRGKDNSVNGFVGRIKDAGNTLRLVSESKHG